MNTIAKNIFTTNMLLFLKNTAYRN